MTEGRRGNGEGSIRKKGKPGKEYYEARILLPDGSRPSLYGQTRREVVDKLREVQNLRSQARSFATSNQTVEQYLYHWLENVVRLQVGATTLETYEKRIRWVLPHFGSKKMARLKMAHIQQAYAAMIDAGLSTQTVYSVHGTMKQAFEGAVAADQLVVNPFRLVKTPRIEQTEMHTLSQEELRRLYTASADDVWHPMWVLLGTTGVRLGEALALRWPYVTEGSIRITRSLHPERGKGMVLGPVKNRASNRTLDITSVCSTALQNHHEGQTVRPLDKELDYVFRHDDNRPFRHEKVRLAFAKALTNAGLPQIRVHDLRHTYATLMLENGIPVHKVAQVLGHSSPNVTSAVYSHVTKKMDADAISAMERILAGSA